MPISFLTTSGLELRPIGWHEYYCRPMHGWVEAKWTDRANQRHRYLVGEAERINGRYTGRVFGDHYIDGELQPPNALDLTRTSAQLDLIDRPVPLTFLGGKVNDNQRVRKSGA